MSFRTLLSLILVGFCLLCGWLVVDSGFFRTTPSTADMTGSASGRQGLLLLRQTTDVAGRPAAQAPAAPVAQLQAADTSDFVAVGGPDADITLGSLDPNSGFKFQLGLTSFGGAIRGATFSEYNDRDPRNPKPLKVLSPIPKGMLPGTFRHIAAGYFNTLGLTSAGTVQLASGDMLSDGEIPSLSNLRVITAGGYHCVALDNSGSIIAWGQDDYGQCANEPNGAGFKAVGAGGFHSLAVKPDGSIVGWGANEWGQVDCPSGTGFEKVTGGLLHSVALRSDGSLVAWGDNRYGQTDVPSGKGFKAIAAGYRHNVALCSDNSIIAWGDNRYGQADVPPGSNFKAVAAGANHCIALKEDGSLVAWGDNSWGQCEVPPGKDFKEIAAGYRHSIALTETGRILQWGGLEPTLPLANTWLYWGTGRSLRLDTYSWKSLGIETAQDGSQTATFELPITDTSAVPVMKLTKTYRVVPGTYLLDCTLKIDNLTDAQQRVSYGLEGPAGLEREAFRQDMRKAVAGFKDAEGQITTSRLDAKTLVKNKTGRGLPLKPRKPGEQFLWVAAVNKYFAAILVPVPEANEPYCDWVTRNTARHYNLDGDKKADSGDETIGVDLETGIAALNPAGQAGSSRTYDFQLYLGPKDKSLFDQDELYRRLGFMQVIDFMPCFCCPAAIINPLAFAILAIMKGMHAFIPNYGVVIIVLVFLMRLIMHPVTKKSQVSMSKMSKLAPRAEEIKKKYANNKAEMNKKLMELYREQGASPIMGFLPMLVQMPIWIALWSAVYTSINLRGARFLPFWITDLSVPDALVSWSPVTIPMLGWKLGSLNLLPILMGVAFYFQQKLMPTQGAATNPQMAQQQKMMAIMMPLLFPLMLYTAPSGVNLYIMASTFAGVIEQKVIRKHIQEKEELEAKGLVPTTSKAGGKVKKKKPKPFFKT